MCGQLYEEPIKVKMRLKVTDTNPQFDRTNEGGYIERKLAGVKENKGNYWL